MEFIERGITMKVYYIDAKGKLVEDASKSLYGAVETPELKAPRFRAMHNGKEMIWVEQEIGLRPVEKPKKKKNG